MTGQGRRTERGTGPRASRVTCGFIVLCHGVFFAAAPGAVRSSCPASRTRQGGFGGNPAADGDGSGDTCGWYPMSDRYQIGIRSVSASRFVVGCLSKGERDGDAGTTSRPYTAERRSVAPRLCASFSRPRGLLAGWGAADHWICRIGKNAQYLVPPGN